MARVLVERLRLLVLLPALTALGGCDMVLMNPAGDIALQQRNLILASTALMLLIIVPVVAATVLFAWRYRASNTQATYTPDWHHSTQLEVLIWTAPLLIIIALGALTWISAHVLDPFREVARIDANRTIPAGTKPLVVEAVSLDWKWLFFYPEEGIATVNELAAPVDTPIQFKITSATVMNTLFVPALAGQIYAMAGMETKLGAVINREGVFDGFSGNYSGAGFSRMNFKFHALDKAGFDAWVAKAKAGGKPLDVATYQALEKPSEGVPPTYFTVPQPDLYGKILNMCVDPGKMCMSAMMAADEKGGTKADSAGTRDRLKYDGARTREGNEAPGATFPASGRPPNSAVQPQGMKPMTTAPEVNERKTPGNAGATHDMPGMDNMSGDKPAPSAAPSQLHLN